MVVKWVQLIRSNWREAMAQKNFVPKFSGNLAVCTLLCMAMVYLLFLNRFREGSLPDDPILKLVHPHDFSRIIFCITYSSLFVILYETLPQPGLFSPALRAFTLLFILRVIFILLMPLKPPVDMIPLHDPFLDKIVGFKGEVTNDLFFSGHAGDLYLFALCCKIGWRKSYLFAAAVVVSIAMVWQKVHYTADVLAAPIFSYACYAIFVKTKDVRQLPLG